MGPSSIAQKIVAAAKRYAFLKFSVLGMIVWKPDSSKLKFSEVTTISSVENVAEMEEALSEVQFVNFGQEKAAAECKCELKGDLTTGKSQSDARKQETSNTKSGSVKAGLPKVLDVGLFEATGGYSVLNADGTTHTETQDSKESSSTAQTYLFRQDVPANYTGILKLCKKTSSNKEVETSVLTITGNIVFSTRSTSVQPINVSIGQLMRVLQSYTDNETKDLVQQLNGIPNENSFVITKSSSVPSKVVKHYFSYEEEPLETHKKKLEQTISDLVAQVEQIPDLVAQVKQLTLENSRLQSELEGRRPKNQV